MGKFIVAIAVVIVVVLQSAAFLRAADHMQDITPEQFVRTQRYIRNICQSRFGVTNEQIEQIKQDLFDDQTAEKCFATCVLEMLNLVINGQIPTHLALLTIDVMLPVDMKDATIASLEKCRSFLPEHPDNVHCVVGHQMFKCMTDNGLKFFFV